MIHEAVQAVALGIAAHLPVALATMPGGAVVSGAGVLVSRNVVDEQVLEQSAVLVQVEQQDAVVDGETIEALEELPTVQIGVTITLWRAKLPALAKATDDDMVQAVRQVARAVGYAIRATFRSGVIDADGVQVRAPRTVTLNEPEIGDDSDITVMTLSLSVPVLDYWALSAGGV